MALEVANTILAQLGGNKFKAMTGAKNFIGSESYLAFKLPRAAKKITHVKIELTPADTYTMTFLNCRTTKTQLKHETVAEHTNVYDDQLQSIFTSETGLYTRL